MDDVALGCLSLSCICHSALIFAINNIHISLLFMEAKERLGMAVNGHLRCQLGLPFSIHPLQI